MKTIFLKLRYLIKITEVIGQIQDFLSKKRKFFDKKLFKNALDKVDEMIKHFTSDENEKIKTVKKTVKTRGKKLLLSDISTFKDAEKYYYENLVYDRSDLDIEKAIINKHTADDFKKLHLLIFESSTKLAKKDILKKIQFFLII